MNTKFSINAALFLCLTGFISSSIQAADKTRSAFNTHSIQASNAWARPTAGNSKMTALYVTLKNDSKKDITITGVQTNLGMAELHRTSTIDGLMRMRKLTHLTIAANEILSMAPRSYHIMVKNLPKTLKKGDIISLTITFSKHVPLKIDVPVRDKSE